MNTKAKRSCIPGIIVALFGAGFVWLGQAMRDPGGWPLLVWASIALLGLSFFLVGSAAAVRRLLGK